MAELTITEALAEIKTIGKRVAKKREGLQPFLWRQEQLKDPLESDGGSVEFISRELQAIDDLEARIITLRAAIAKANAETILTVDGSTRTIADWLTWRREVAPGRQQFISTLRNQIASARQQAQQKGLGVVSATATVVNADVKPSDLLINISEGQLAMEADHLQEVLGILDGQLSLKNATTTVNA